MSIPDRSAAVRLRSGDIWALRPTDPASCRERNRIMSHKLQHVLLVLGLLVKVEGKQ